MSEDRRPFHNPFAALAPLRGRTPTDAPIPADPAPTTAGHSTVPTHTPTVARAVVRIERAGRRGKEVTVIEHLALPADELAHWLRALKSSLGCGGAVEESAIVLQGDQRSRAARLLTDRGVKRVTVA